MEFLEFIKEIDFFGKFPEFYINRKPKHVTIIGRIFTYIFIFLYIVIIGYKFYRMTQRVDITFYDSYSISEETPSIKINNENFYLIFAILDKDDQPFINESIYYPKAYYMGEVKKEIKLERCQMNKIGSKYKNLFSGYDLNNYYCLDKVDYIFNAYDNSILIQLFPCKNTTDNNNCQSIEEIDEHINGRNFEIVFEDILVTPLNYSIPIKERTNFVFTTLYKNFGQFLYTEMQLVNVETSTNIIGFDFLTNPKIEEFIKYDSLEIIPQPGYDLNDKNNNYSICDVQFQLNDKILTEKKQYLQLIDILGEVGGIMEFIFSFLNLIFNFIGDLLYEKSIINSLFSFDIKRKVIILKKRKNNEFKITEELNSDKNILRKQMTPTHDHIKYNYYKGRNKSFNENDKYISDKNSVNYLIPKKNTLETNGNKDDKTIEKNKTIANKIIKLKSNKKSNSIIYNKIIANKDNINFETSKNYILDKISLKKLLISKISCFSKYEKNAYKILLEETMNVVSKKLDIFNIFRMLFVVETNSNNFNLNIDCMKVSEGEITKLLTSN